MVGTSLAVLAHRDRAAGEGAGIVPALAGDDDLADLREICERGSRPLLTTGGSTTLDELCAVWARLVPFDRLLESAWPVATAAAGLDRAELAVRLGLRDRAARARWIHEWARDDQARTAAWLCGLAVDRTPLTLEATPVDRRRTVTALASLVPSSVPAVVVTVELRDGGDPVVGCDTAARLAVAFLSWAPTAPIAVAAPAGVLHRYFVEAPESTAKARLRQGALRWPVDPALDTPAASAASAGRSSARRLPQPGRHQRHRHVEALDDPERARSEAEARLFAALEADPRTRGRFALNHCIDADFGGRPAEIDLACQQSRLAVEVDGYHHFRDAHDYRRDRRKDLLLQLQGWVVQRVLADDIGDDVSAVVGTIATTLSALPKGAPFPP
jgi:very-short-patch-repair endonuclease